jgi:hypothetical protein
MFAYGIPSFYCESSYNVDLRQAFNNLEGDFYPHVSSGIPDNWLQESVVPIVFDNTYYYNVTFSKQNRENVFTHLPADWVEELCSEDALAFRNMDVLVIHNFGSKPITAPSGELLISSSTDSSSSILPNETRWLRVS